MTDQPTVPTPAGGVPIPPAPQPASAPSGVSVATITTVLPELLAWAVQRGNKTSEGFATVLGPLISGVVSFVITFFVAHSLLSSDQAVALVSAVVPALTTLAAGYAAKGYADGRALLKREVIAHHLPWPGQ